MKIKKLLIVVLTLAMALAFTLVFTGCGSSDEEAVAPTEQATEENTEHANPTNIYASMAGDYQDEVSQRATATLVADLESDNVQITVMWAEDADDAEKWEMTGVMDGEKLVYTDCKNTEIEYDAAGNVVNEDIDYTNGSGYFEFGSDGALLWTGAEDDDCRACSFVMVQGE